MTTGAFLRRLKVLNPTLRVCTFGTNGKLAGLHYIDKTGEYQDICGVDKQYVPEYTEWDEQGHIVKSGWRRVYLILLKLGLTTPQRITKVCPGFFMHWSQSAVDEDRRVQIQGDAIRQKIEKFAEAAPRMTWKDPDSGELREGSVLTTDQNLELAEDIRKKDTQARKEQDEKDRWFLETWRQRGGNQSDKPNY